MQGSAARDPAALAPPPLCFPSLSRQRLHVGSSSKMQAGPGSVAGCLQVCRPARLRVACVQVARQGAQKHDGPAPHVVVLPLAEAGRRSLQGVNKGPARLGLRTAQTAVNAEGHRRRAGTRLRVVCGCACKRVCVCVQGLAARCAHVASHPATHSSASCRPMAPSPARAKAGSQPRGPHGVPSYPDRLQKAAASPLGCPAHGHPQQPRLQQSHTYG